MRVWIFLLYICTILANSTVSNAQMAVFDNSRIENIVVKTMSADSQYYYLFVKDTCGALAPINSKVLKLQWDTFKDAAVAMLLLNIRYFQARFGSLQGEGLSVEVQRILSSPGAQVALQECYGSNETARTLYAHLLINNDREATKDAAVVNIIGGGFIFGVVARVGWAPLAWGMRTLGKSPEVIATAKKVTMTGLGTAMTAGMALGVHGQMNDIAEENKHDNEIFACETQTATPEKMVDNDVQSFANNKSAFWLEALRADLNRLFSVYSDCREQNLNANQIKILEEKIKKYTQVKLENDL